MPHAFAGREVGRPIVVVLAGIVAVARGLGISHPRGALRHDTRGGDTEPEGPDQQQGEE